MADPAAFRDPSRDVRAFRGAEKKVAEKPEMGGVPAGDNDAQAARGVGNRAERVHRDRYRVRDGVFEGDDFVRDFSNSFVRDGRFDGCVRAEGQGVWSRG